VNGERTAQNREICQPPVKKETSRFGPVPVRIRRPLCATTKPRRLFTLDWLAAIELRVPETPQPGDPGGLSPREPNEAPGETAVPVLVKAVLSGNPFGCRVPSMHTGEASGHQDCGGDDPTDVSDG
jgi:hypothetical protein